MPDVQITPNIVIITGSCFDTETWANRPNARWPCSELSGNKIVAEFDKGGLIDLNIFDYADQLIDDLPNLTSNELTAFCVDTLNSLCTLNPDHPCAIYFEEVQR